jgi:hypothetical protein
MKGHEYHNYMQRLCGIWFPYINQITGIRRKKIKSYKKAIAKIRSKV